jgi:putative transcriptional regulator
MTSHPNRSKANRYMKQNPTSAEVRAAREAAGLTQTQAAAMIYGTLRSWQNYEAEEGAADARRMHPGLFELFLLKTAQLSLEAAIEAVGELER